MGLCIGLCATALAVQGEPRRAEDGADGVRLAQVSDTDPVRPGAPEASGQAPQGPPPGAPAPPPLPVLLGFGDLMLTLDRPYEAEKIYGGILAFDPDNTAAQQGMLDVAQAKRPTWTTLAHYYEDTHDVRLYAYGGGPTFRLPWGRVTVTAGTGHYRNDNNPRNRKNPLSQLPTIPTAEDDDTLRKRTFNVLLEPHWDKFEGSLFLSRVTYDTAPDRWLYDLRVSYVLSPRQRYTFSRGRHDSYFQNVQEQFMAPETYWMVTRPILFNDTSIAAEYPVHEKVDFTFSYRDFQYSDGNSRDNFRSQLLYRIRGDQRKPNPVVRAGLDAIFDDSKFFTLDYSASARFDAVLAAVDYLYLSRKTKYGFYAAYPLWDQNFDAPAIFFGYASTWFSDQHEAYVKIFGLNAPGTSLNFGDYVIGVNSRF